MNAAIQRLFSRHELGTPRRVETLSGGRLNTVLRVNGEYVLRCREPALATGSLLREAAILGRLQGRVPAPEPVAAGMDDLLGEYLIQKWVPGRSLLHCWLENPDVPAREWWIAQWIAALRAVHEERFPRPGSLPEGRLKESPSWRHYVETRLRARLDALMRQPSVDRELLLAAERYLRRHAAVLEDGPFCLIHRDLHFGNVLVEGPHLTALVDFELAEAGPPDYELDTIYRFLAYPWEFAGPERAAAARPVRFASVWVRLRRSYPEMFQAPRLRERLSLYALDHDLSCLLQACQGRGRLPGPEVGRSAVMEGLQARLALILRDRYGPE